MNVVVEEMDIIDKEWLALILEAKEMGISIEEVRDFFTQNGIA